MCFVGTRYFRLVSKIEASAGPIRGRNSMGAAIKGGMFVKSPREFATYSKREEASSRSASRLELREQIFSSEHVEDRSFVELCSRSIGCLKVGTTCSLDDGVFFVIQFAQGRVRCGRKSV
jgi:hypothetical protein